MVKAIFSNPLTRKVVASTMFATAVVGANATNLKNENNDIQVEIGGFYFNLADCERANIVIDEDLPPQAALMIGNPAMANAFFALMDMGESPFTMDTNKLTENFCLLVITMDYAES